MCNENNAYAFILEFSHYSEELCGFIDIQARGGLVQNQHFCRSNIKGPGDGDPLLLAARQNLVPRRVLLDAIHEVAEPDQIENARDLLDATVGVGRVRVV